MVSIKLHGIWDVLKLSLGVLVCGEPSEVQWIPKSWNRGWICLIVDSTKLEYGFRLIHAAFGAWRMVMFQLSGFYCICMEPSEVYAERHQKLTLRSVSQKVNVDPGSCC